MIDKNKLLKWLNERHADCSKKSDSAGNYLIEGMCLGNMSMAHELSTLIEGGEFDIQSSSKLVIQLYNGAYLRTVFETAITIGGVETTIGETNDIRYAKVFSSKHDVEFIEAMDIVNDEYCGVQGIVDLNTLKYV